jgi:flagellar motor protein MotB
MENFNVGGRRLKAVGFGYDQPKTPGDPYADINRRVELIRAN